jgi:methionyl aminopeptidase
VGEIAPDRHHLLEVTEKALYAGIAQSRPDRHMGDIGAAMDRVARAAGYVVQPQYGGHGVGRNLHEDPHVPNFGDPGKGVRLRVGMTLAIEPIVIAGSDPTARELDDKWTVVSPTALMSAQFEHTVAITKDGPQILTVL